MSVNTPISFQLSLYLLKTIWASIEIAGDKERKVSGAEEKRIGKEEKKKKKNQETWSIQK